MNPELTRIAELEAVRVQGSGDTCIVLCHGFGANAFDLAPLSAHVKARPNTTWIFPQAPLEFAIGPGMSGRAWFPLVAEELARLVASGQKVTYSQVVPPGLASAREKLEGLIEALPFPRERISIGGFSQGAMMATDLFLRSTELFAGLIILSGTLICENDWKTLAAAKAGFQFFQSHGMYDPVLPFENAKRLEGLLREAGLSGEFVSFQGAHEIPEGVLKRMANYLMR
ncbi:MAG: esterase [Leptospirales bacterium]|nr:esterase [Leptospirales bacterium]